ncbi:MAG TPA: aminotransferase class I/II-fold pyridoxal phosphate-dependent enzyme [Magnetospirillum sp.]|nr:aminotransferase class I/II-fold pyridoxal phosphate-dependent enzyme [Magnetospirillum sp.]
MIPLAVPNLSGNEGRYLQECVQSTFVSTVGPFVTRLEEMVAASAGGSGAVATSAGTAALHAALLAVGVRPGDLVILPSFTFIASANAVAHCGATPWLMDADPFRWTLDPNQLESLLENEAEVIGKDLYRRACGRRVAAILPVFTLGIAPEMDAINAIAKRFGLPVIADAAAAIGVQVGGEPVTAAADLVCFSFNGNKTVTSGGGGAVAGRDANLLKRVRHLTTTARISTDYTHDMVGYNYRMTNIEAAVGVAQLEQLDTFLAAKRRIRKGYDDAFRGMPGVELFPEVSEDENVCWFSGVVLDADVHPSVKTVCDKLREAGVEGRTFWRPIHTQPPFVTAPRGAMDVVDGLWGRVLTLPCSTSLTEADQAKVIDALTGILRRTA